MEHTLSVSLKSFCYGAPPFSFININSRLLQDRTVNMFSQVDREFGNKLAEGLKKYVDM
jgi:hypothetical protein